MNKIKNIILQCYPLLVFSCSTSAAVPSKPPGLAEKKPEHKINNGVLKVSLGDVARELGVTEDSLRQHAETLGTSLEKKKLQADLCSNEKKVAAYCSVVTLLENDNYFTAASSPPKARHRRRHLHIRDAAHLQSETYAELVAGTQALAASEIYRALPQIVRSSECPRNFSAALMRRLEVELPAAEARAGIEALYDHAKKCLSVNDEAYESTHFRFALLKYLWGNTDAARESIRAAVLAKESDDKPRILYWAGVLAESPAVRAEYWDKLVQDFPLSYHALEVWKERRQDPLQIISARPAIEITRNSLGSGLVSDTAIRWLEAIYLTGHPAGGRRLADWIGRRFAPELTPQTLLYISQLKSDEKSQLNSIVFLTKQIRGKPEVLNLQALQILFPADYLQLARDSAPQSDPYFLLSVARQESGFNPEARSIANAKGLLQLLPSTARRLVGRHSRPDLYDSRVNMHLGAQFLDELSALTGRVEYALAAFNAGPRKVPEWTARYPTQNLQLFLDLIPFHETRGYISSILRNYYWYSRLYDDGGIRSRDVHIKSQLVEALVLAHTSQDKVLEREPARATATQ